jgi:hypothetical protein
MGGYQSSSGAAPMTGRYTRRPHACCPSGGTGTLAGASDEPDRLKILFHRETLELLGAHIFGENAAELLHIGHAVFRLKGKIIYFINTVFNYPPLAECYKTAAFHGLDRFS